MGALSWPDVAEMGEQLSRDIHNTSRGGFGVTATLCPSTANGYTFVCANEHNLQRDSRREWRARGHLAESCSSTTISAPRIPLLD
jgi:hypothetical protein